ncbi:hypothetical protein BDP27DRAFT_1432475 [Rhodocollybia butyracea]|uniref:Uncharacterized protein n=1 Tax=Rhodocollybia butyracea TaxID=206335 RepID=A0A9P5PAK3_9AGAR|nr:hypothetical protein BDP27DRAFT_1432475 [Rhodocollybia butyracea]
MKTEKILSPLTFLALLLQPLNPFQRPCSAADPDQAHRNSTPLSPLPTYSDPPFNSHIFTFEAFAGLAFPTPAPAPAPFPPTPPSSLPASASSTPPQHHRPRSIRVHPHRIREQAQAQQTRASSPTAVSPSMESPPSRTAMETD